MGTHEYVFPGKRGMQLKHFSFSKNEMYVSVNGPDEYFFSVKRSAQLKPVDFAKNLKGIYRLLEHSSLQP